MREKIFIYLFIFAPAIEIDKLALGRVQHQAEYRGHRTFFSKKKKADLFKNRDRTQKDVVDQECITTFD